MPPPPPPAPVLMEELVEQFLLRVAPDDPATLVRAALVCKPWCRLVSSPGFRRRFREHHRTPPMLGFCYVVYNDRKDEDITRFAPTTSFKPPRRIRRFWRALDSRHGRVLLHAVNWGDGPFVVWDPITDEKRELPILPRLRDLYMWSATVFCSASSKCNHLDCQRGAFNVVAALTSCNEMLVYVYSSEAGSWSRVSAPKTGEDFLTEPGAPGALVKNAVYFSCFFNKKIFKYDLGTQEISLIDGPPPCSNFQGSSVLMATEDGRLGVAYVLNSKLHIWSSEVGPNRDSRWTISRVVELAALPPFSALSCPLRVKGSADGVGIILLWSLDGLFTIDLKSGQARKIFEDRDMSQYVVPFMAFYTQALGMAGEVPNDGTSST